MSLRDFIASGASIMDYFHDGVVIVDQLGIVRYVNEANDRITGMNKEDVIGKHVRDVVPDSHLLDVLATGRSITDKLTRVGDKIVISNIVPVHDKDRRLTGAVSVFRDLTETLQLSRKLSEAENIIEDLKQKLSISGKSDEHGMLTGNSPKMQRVVQLAYKAAQVNSTVVIEGESGTGKEMLARFIHQHSDRADNPFVPVNCASIPETLIESELFGYEEGAFSGARRGGKPGMFELAGGGTLFLDELEELSLHIQAKLLRVIQNKELMRVGGTQKKSIDVRIIGASNKNIADMVREKMIREDLYYRINVVRIEIPPLRERKEDIPLFLQHILNKMSKKLKKRMKKIHPEAMKRLLEYSFPGNIRELENIIELAMILDDNHILELNDLPESVAHLTRESQGQGESQSRLGCSIENRLVPTLEETEKQLLQDVLQQTDNRSKAAKILGISRATLYRKLKIYDLL